MRGPRQSYKISVYDRFDDSVHEITWKRHPYSGWVMKVDREFWCDCENENEIDSEVSDIMNLYKWSYVKAV